MKVIIAGGRNIHSRFTVEEAIRLSGIAITEVVTGGAKGVDDTAWLWARDNGKKRFCFKPAWGKYGRSAGPIRNAKMADYADALIAVWDGKSPGTKNMIETAKKKGLLVYVHEVE